MGVMEVPFLKRISLEWESVSPQDRRKFPFNIPAIRSIRSFDFNSNVTFFIGDNGSGKSTLLESIGVSCGFSIVGGRDLVLNKEKDNTSLSDIIKISWFPKVSKGFY